jgi:hypothetical protein
MDASFGQEQLEKAKTCLKAFLIRTGAVEKNKNLSEWKLHSDRGSRKKQKPV